METTILIVVALMVGLPALALWGWTKALEDLEEQYTNDDR
jgi:uncharacterized membrane protein